MLPEKELQCLHRSPGLFLRDYAESANELWPVRVRIVDGGQSAEAGARSDELQIPDTVGR
jgi:hypothetical protein